MNAARESDLDMREHERDLYRRIEPRVVQMFGRERAGEQEWREQCESKCDGYSFCQGSKCCRNPEHEWLEACEAEEAPSVPFRKNPNLPWWRRLLMRFGY